MSISVQPRDNGWPVPPARGDLGSSCPGSCAPSSGAACSSHASDASERASSGELVGWWPALLPRRSGGSRASPTPSERLAAAAWGSPPRRVVQRIGDSVSELRELLGGPRKKAGADAQSPAGSQLPAGSAAGADAGSRGGSAECHVGAGGGTAAAWYYQRRRQALPLPVSKPCYGTVLDEPQQHGGPALAPPRTHCGPAAAAGAADAMRVRPHAAAAWSSHSSMSSLGEQQHSHEHDQQHQQPQEYQLKQHYHFTDYDLEAEKALLEAAAAARPLWVPPRRLLAGAYVLINLLATVLIVLSNKLVLSTYRFSFPVALTLLHAAFTALGVELMAAGGLFERRAVAPQETMSIAFAYVASIVLSNWSIQLNTIGFYQLCKVLITPSVVGLEWAWLRKVPGRGAVTSISALLAGICIATLLDKQVSSNLFGAAMGLASTVSCAVYQVLAAKKQRDLGLNGTQLLHQTMPTAAALLALLVPLVEPLGLPSAANNHSWGGRGTLLGYELSVPAITAIFGSAALGLVVTLSAFLVIGATSALTYNVCSHCKTLLILACGVLFFGDTLGAPKLLGLLLAFGGIVAYSSLK